MEPSTSDDPTTAIIRNLNDLPEHLLLHMLSLLPTIDAIKTSSISRRWRNLWSSIPSLNFSFDLFPPSECPYETRHRFADSVNQTLILRRPHSPLHTFRFQFDFREYEYTSILTSWIRHAVTRGVRNLEIDFFIDPRFHTYDNPEDEMYFEFPFQALRNGQIRVLKLKRSDITFPKNMGSVKFTSLRSVFINQSHFTDVMVSDLVVGCPNIESLSLHFCFGMYNAKICSFSIKELSLRHVHAKEDSPSSVEIDCPELRSLELVWYEVGKYSLKNSAKLVEARVSFLHLFWYYKYWSKVVPLLGNVSKLSLENCWWFKPQPMVKNPLPPRALISACMTCTSYCECIGTRGKGSFFLRLFAGIIAKYTMDLSSLNKQVQLLELKDVSAGSLKFHNLRWLEMQTGYSKSEILGIAALLEVSPNLDTLILDHDYVMNEDGSMSEEMLNKPINLSLPRLGQAKMKTFTGSKEEHMFLNLLKNQGLVCQKIVVLPMKIGKVPYCPVVWVRNPDGTFVQESSSHLEDASSN